MSKHFKNILFIRPDDMGDVLMCTPAFRALKESFGCRITLLTSGMAQPIGHFISDIDEVLVSDVPWVKLQGNASDQTGFANLIQQLKNAHFDIAIISTVYSQSSLPAAMLAWMAEIPSRLAYCRENPYELLTHWIPDKEPLMTIQHQARRELLLVEQIGATATAEHLQLNIDKNAWQQTRNKIVRLGASAEKRWVVFHAGVSEKKRQWPMEHWIELAQQVSDVMGCQILFTGVEKESSLCNALATATGMNSVSLAGDLNMKEFLFLIDNAALIITVNTVTAHIAAATSTPVIVLYAATNLQHFPWMATGHVFMFECVAGLQSKNEIILFAQKKWGVGCSEIDIEEVADAACDILITGLAPTIPSIPINASHYAFPQPLKPAAEIV